MKKEITLQQNKIKYTLRVSKKAKSLRLTIYCDGNFLVTAPKRMSQNFIEQFLLEKSQWIIEKLSQFKNSAGQILVKDTKADYAKYKNQALTLAKTRLEYFNQFYGLQFNKINIKNQKTRWGSCSKKGNLNFNFKIALLPPVLADYIIVHELCHLQQFNHSKNFWQLVAKTMPDYLAHRRELRKDKVRFN
ncbi:MAG: SprT family zinc-dependent metalloprotease [Candidatus Buchananbacteria bacterium]